MKKDRLTDWRKNEKRYLNCAKAVLIACLPIIACLLYCGLQGKSIGAVYLPSSVRNDELIYYKQVEAILDYGYPQGYFGFNESHALKLSFAAWSPVLLLPWVLWGLVFGWNLLSPILCNIFLLTLAMFLFTLLARPTWRQMGILTFLFSLYTPFAWYMLSAMPEIVCISMLIVFYGAVIAYLRCEKKAFLLIMYLLTGLLTLMRPYMLLFMLLPMYFGTVRSPWASCGNIAESGKKIRIKVGGLLGAAVTAGGVLVAYVCINHFLAAEYFEPLYYMNWITAFFEKGLIGGMRNFLGTLYYAVLEFGRYMQRGMRNDSAAGAIFCCYVVLFLLLLYQTLRDYIVWHRQYISIGEDGGDGKLRLSYSRLVVEFHLTLAFFGMWMAQLLMKNFYDGCKHLLIFVAAAILVVSFMETRYYKKAVVVGMAFAFFFTYHEMEFRDYQPAFAEATVVEQVETWSEAIRREFVLTGETRPNYENAVIWVLADECPEGFIYTRWQYLYALPSGFGISCCTADYVTEHFDSLRSRYLCVVPGGFVEESCIRMGYEKIVGNEYAVLYRRY